MCGIIAIMGRRPVAPLLLEGLQRLEYRGYDSAGVAALVDGHIERRRAVGKIAQLGERLAREPLGGVTGIGHTRWATHGRPNEINAHPHTNGKLALVHNGIIENHRELRSELEAEGYRFETETDTEAILHLVGRNLEQGMAPREAVAQALGRLEGAFALAMIFAGHHDLMIGARRGSPLALGYGEGELYLGSDALALAPLTNRICYLEEGDWVVLQEGRVEIFDAAHRPIERPVVQSALSGAAIGKGKYRHFMQKEIHEQPTVIGDTLHSYVNLQQGRVALPELPLDFATLPRLTIAACGTAYYAGYVAKYWFEQLARLPVELDVASEFRYREAPMPEGGAALFISQSGETIDTLAALRYARSQGQVILSIVNQTESVIGRESDLLLPTLAGPEIGVASTKAFTTQLTVLACLALAAARARGVIDAGTEARLTAALTALPAAITQILAESEALQEVAQELMAVKDVLYIGRGALFPLALEGALKLKEISYIHAEGYAGGELKHGPIALLDEQMPVVAAAPSGPLFDKLASNIQETIARGGRTIILSDAAGLAQIGEGAAHKIELPEVEPFVAPILYALPMQLLAYYTAVARGTDVDQPRNLAKSVTVE